MNIELRDLSKAFRKSVALNRVTLQFEPGQLIALLGANGCGKTTMLRSMAGIISPTLGEIIYDGRAFQRDAIDFRRRLMFLADFPYVFWEMTVIQHIGMCLRVYKTEREGIEDFTLQLLRDFDLLPLVDKPLHALSRGQLYKTALCGLMAVDPELWLLDEPFASGMDPHGISAFRERARDATRRGRTIIYSTQILEVVEKFSDRVCILERGEVRGFGAVAELQATNGPEALEQLLNSLREPA